MCNFKSMYYIHSDAYTIQPVLLNVRHGCLRTYTMLSVWKKLRKPTHGTLDYHKLSMG